MPLVKINKIKQNILYMQIHEESCKTVKLKTDYCLEGRVASFSTRKNKSVSITFIQSKELRTHSQWINLGILIF